MTIETTPVSPLEASIRDLRLAQAELDDCEEDFNRLSIELSEVRLRRETLRDNLDMARENMFVQVVKPQNVVEPIRVMPTYREEPVLIEEGPTDAAWSANGSGPDENRERLRVADGAWSDEKATDA